MLVRNYVNNAVCVCVCVFAISPNGASIEMEMNDSWQTHAHKVTAVFRHLLAFAPLSDHNYGLSNEERPLGKFGKPHCGVSNFHINYNYGDSESLHPAEVWVENNVLDNWLHLGHKRARPFDIQAFYMLFQYFFFFFYHDSFEGIFNLLNASIGKILLLLLHLHVPVVGASRHCASPGFYIHAEDPLAFW